MSKNQQKQAFNSAETLRDSAAPATQPIINEAGTNYSNSYGSADKTYQDLSTGGFTDADKTAYINRAGESQDAASQALQAQTQLQAAKTGQGNPMAATSRIARQLAQGKAQSINDAQVGLNTQINANKATGATGEANLAAGSAQQRLAALGLQFNTEAEAQQYLNQIALGQKGPLQNAEDIGKLAAGGTAGILGAM